MNNLFKRFLAFGAGNIIVLILGFISTPLITRIIDPNELGKFSMFSTITNLVLLLAIMGLDQAFVRFFFEEKEDQRFNLFKKSLQFPCYLMIILSILALFCYKNISNFLVGETSIFIIILFVIQCIFSMFSRFTLLLIRMNQKAKLYSILQVIGKITYIIIILCLMNFIKDYKVTVIALVSSNILVTIVALCTQRKQIFLSPKKKLKTTQKELLQYGSPLILTMAITWIMQSIDKLFIQKLTGYSELGLYASAFSIIALISVLQNTFTTFWVPVANEKFSKNPDDRIFFENITSYIVIIMSIMSIGMIVCKDLISILLGEQYREAIFIFPFLIFIPVMYTISETTVVGISFMKKTKYTIWIAIISAVTNIIGNVLLVPILGAKGAAISTGISYIIFFITRTLISRKLYNVNYHLSKILIVILGMSILAIYASFNTIDILIIILGIVNLVIVLMLYKDITKQAIKFIKKKVKLN